MQKLPLCQNLINNGLNIYGLHPVASGTLDMMGILLIMNEGPFFNGAMEPDTGGQTGKLN